MLSRRSFIIGLIAAPAIIRTPGLIMPVRDRCRTQLTGPLLGNPSARHFLTEDERIGALDDDAPSGGQHPD
jgi:hypothetical protein